MPKILVPKEMYAKVQSFKPVIDHLIEADLTVAQCTLLILEQGLDSMLADLLGSQEQPVLLKSLQLLAAKHPTQVYTFVAQMLEEGAVQQERERLRQKLGFKPTLHA